MYALRLGCPPYDTDKAGQREEQGPLSAEEGGCMIELCHAVVASTGSTDEVPDEDQVLGRRQFQVGRGADTEEELRDRAERG